MSVEKPGADSRTNTGGEVKPAQEAAPPTLQKLIPLPKMQVSTHMQAPQRATKD